MTASYLRSILVATLIAVTYASCTSSKHANGTRLVHITDSANRSITLVPNPVRLKKGVAFNLNLPAGYHASVAFEGLHRLRFLTRSPDGRLFAADMHDLTDNRQSRIYIFEGWDEALHRFRSVHTYLQRLHNVTQVAFYRDNGTDYIYVPETGKLTRYEYHAGDMAPRGRVQVIATFPAYGLSYKYGGWHLTRSLAFHNGKLYVSVGSSCNACIEKEDVRATILEMDPDGSNRRIYASGLRNSVGIKWIGDELWATGMGQDKLGDDRPDDIFTRVRENQFYGWPYFYQYKDKVYRDEQFTDSLLTTRAKPVTAYCGFAAHSAPLGFDYFSSFSDPLLTGSFLVALHGSTDATLNRGNAVVKVTAKGTYVVIADGFLTGTSAAARHGRPCDVMMNDERSFFVTDDHNGVLYYIWK